jgi:hypothetical protein
MEQSSRWRYQRITNWDKWFHFSHKNFEFILKFNVNKWIRRFVVQLIGQHVAHVCIFGWCITIHLIFQVFRATSFITDELRNLNALTRRRWRGVWGGRWRTRNKKGGVKIQHKSNFFRKFKVSRWNITSYQNLTQSLWFSALLPSTFDRFSSSAFAPMTWFQQWMTSSSLKKKKTLLISFTRYHMTMFY